LPVGECKKRPSESSPRRLEISRAALSKHIRRGLITPDYVSDRGSFFDAENLPKVAAALEENRLKTWRHIPVRLKDGYVVTRLARA
jgi:hypothetical protein